MKLVIHPPVDEVRLARIRQAAGPMHVVNAHDHDVGTEIVEADAFFGKITPFLLGQARRLVWVQSPTASLEHYVFDALIEHPCALSNMRGLFSDVIADHVFGFIICFARNFHVYLRQQFHGTWDAVGGEAGRPDFVSGPGISGPGISGPGISGPGISGPGVASSIDKAHLHLADCTLGIVGAGAIGREVGRRARAHDMRVVAVDPVVRSIPDVCEVWPADRLHDMLSAADFVVIAAPHTPETDKLFCRRQFEQMKRTAYLINVGRGAIVDLADLTQALAEGRIAGAGLDVFEIEPLPVKHPLWMMPNVIITPHVAGASPRIAERHTEVLLDNIRRFVAGRPPATLVDKRRWY